MEKRYIIMVQDCETGSFSFATHKPEMLTRAEAEERVREYDQAFQGLKFHIFESVEAL